MKVTIKDGKVICTKENPIEKLREFLSDCWYCLEGHDSEGNLKMWERSDQEGTAEGRLDDAISSLEGLIRNADQYGVAVDNEVRELLQSKRAEKDELLLREKKKDEEFVNKEKWRSLSTHGCGLCKNKKRQVFGDDVEWQCTATGTICETKNEPYYDGCVWRLFHLVPYPNGQCPYKTEAIDETDEEYIKYKRRKALRF